MGWAEDIWNSAKQKVSNVTEKIGNAIDDGISFVKDNAHTLLDAAGFIPGVGTVADVINAGIYVAEGDWKNAGLCALSAVPGIGDGIAAVGKVAKVGKAVKVGKTISKVGKTVNTVVWRGKSTIDALKGDPTGAILDVLFSGKWKFKQKLGNFLGKVGKKISYRLKPLLGRLGGVKDWLKKLLGKVKTGASKAGQKLTQWGKNLASKLKQKLSDLKARLKSFGKKVKDKILEATCFTEDTLVYTKEGYVPIQNIRAGDDIYSREERTGETGFQKVEEVFLRSVHTIYTIEVNTTTKIQTTTKHPFYVEGEGWIAANQLQVGMKLQTINGTAVITDLRKERTEEEIPVYNFRVSEWSSYFVSEWNVYVHNGKGYKRGSRDLNNVEDGVVINSSKDSPEFGELNPITSLNKRQRELLELFNGSDGMVTVRKKSVSMNDLLQLTNVTGDEFNMFTRRGERLIIRGHGNKITVSKEVYNELISGGYRFSGHTHPPGYSIEPGPRDGPFLWEFGQRRSAIWGTGPDKYKRTHKGGLLFGVDNFATEEVRRELEREAMRKLYENQ